MKKQIIVIGSVSSFLIITIIFLPVLLNLLGFILWGLTSSVPVYNEVVYIGVDFEKETEFELLLPIIIQNNDTHDVIVGSLKNLVQDYSSREETFTVQLITESVSISNQTIEVTFLSIIGTASKIELYKEYRFQPKSTISHESNLFSTTLSGYNEESDIFHRTKSLFYYQFGTNNQASGNLYYFFSASTNFCNLHIGNGGNLDKYTDISQRGAYLIEKTYTGASWEDISVEPGASCA